MKLSLPWQKEEEVSTKPEILCNMCSNLYGTDHYTCSNASAYDAEGEHFKGYCGCYCNLPPQPPAPVEKPKAHPHWWRPLITRDPQERAQHGGMIRLIGLELRMRINGYQEEIQMVPLQIEIPGTQNAADLWEFGPLTLHTSVGDVNIPAQRIPASGM